MLFYMSVFNVSFNFSDLFKACRRYSHDGNCVSACPTTRFYNVHTSSWEINKEGKVALGHVCIANCPGILFLTFYIISGHLPCTNRLLVFDRWLSSGWSALCA